MKMNIFSGYGSLPEKGGESPWGIRGGDCKDGNLFRSSCGMSAADGFGEAARTVAQALAER
jgi:hypothetical protein